MWRSLIDVSEHAVGQLWSSVFGHSEWKHLIHFIMADEKMSLWKYGRGEWLNFVLNLGRAVKKHLKCYSKHMVVKHLAVLQYFSGGSTSKAATREWSTKHVLAGHPLRLRMSILSRLRSCWKMTEANVTRTFGYIEHLLRTHSAHCNRDTANASRVCQVGIQESHRRADATKSSGVHEHCSNVWDDSEFLNLDCDVWRIVDSSLRPVIKTTVKCVETLKFATTQKIPFISLGG